MAIRLMFERPFLSVVVPFYNEEKNVALMYDAVRDACQKLQRSHEIIFVDDGSSDRTFDVLERLHLKDNTVKVIRFRKNYGQTSAMAAGFRGARGKVVVSMDGDLQNDPADIPLLVAKLEEGYDVVCGWRKDRKDKFISRKIPSKIANWLIAQITGVKIHDNGCSLKAYRATVIKRVALYSEFHRFIPAMATLTGARIAEIVVRHHARRFGESKYGISRAWRVFLDLFLVKMLTGFASRPLAWFGTFSIPASVLGFVCLLSMAAASGVVLPSVAFLFFALAGHLVVMGILGEMVLHTGNYRPERVLDASTLKIRGRGSKYQR